MHKIAGRMHSSQSSKGNARRTCARPGAGLEARMTKPKNLWGGLFTGKGDAGFVEFNRSFGFDRRLFEVDVRASIAHCSGLLGAGVLSGDEATKIKDGLEAIQARGLSDSNYFDELQAEDIHSFVEARLVELIGETGRKLHTGRSRNDQVATIRDRCCAKQFLHLLLEHARLQK